MANVHGSEGTRCARAQAFSDCGADCSRSFHEGTQRPEYWGEISYQERNNNLLLSETIKLIEQMKVGDIDIIECGIEIGYREQM